MRSAALEVLRTGDPALPVRLPWPSRRRHEPAGLARVSVLVEPPRQRYTHISSPDNWPLVHAVGQSTAKRSEADNQPGNMHVATHTPPVTKSL
jgi:hypothetical protein